MAPPWEFVGPTPIPESWVTAGSRRWISFGFAEGIHLTTDRGQFALPRQITRGKLAPMVAAAEQLRTEIGS